MVRLWSILNSRWSDRLPVTLGASNPLPAQACATMSRNDPGPLSLALVTTVAGRQASRAAAQGADVGAVTGGSVGNGGIVDPANKAAPRWSFSQVAGQAPGYAINSAAAQLQAIVSVGHLLFLNQPDRTSGRGAAAVPF